MNFYQLSLALYEKKGNTKVQTLIFSKERFTTSEAAEEWAATHGFTKAKVDETGESWRLRQRNPGDFQKGSFRTIPMTDGIKAVIGVPKEG